MSLLGKVVIVCYTLVSSTKSSGNQVEPVVPGPDFVSGVKNVTVPEGRDVTLSCTVMRLGTHKVAWIHYDRSAILTVQNNVITRNPRIGVSHDGHSVWNLHIRDVERSDEGQYMCQINTARAKTRLGNLHVVVPPRIVDSLSSSDMVQTEGSNVTLECVASGSPEPDVIWRREDSREISIDKNTTAEEVSGPMLKLWKVSRMDMGAYMCIARNGVPPAVSKRIELGIDFTPMIWVPAQLVGAFHGETVTLTCFVEAHPASLNYWEKDGTMIHQDEHYTVAQERGTPQYKVEMKLIIKDAGESNFGKYSCVAKNPRGQTDGSITLYEEGYGASPKDISEEQYNKKRRQDRRRNKDRHHRRTTETAWYDLDPVPQYSGSSQLRSSSRETLVRLILVFLCILVSSKSVTSAFLVFSSIFISCLTPSLRMEN